MLVYLIHMWYIIELKKEWEVSSKKCPLLDNKAEFLKSGKKIKIEEVQVD